MLVSQLEPQGAHLACKRHGVSNYVGMHDSAMRCATGHTDAATGVYGDGAGLRFFSGLPCRRLRRGYRDFFVYNDDNV